MLIIVPFFRFRIDRPHFLGNVVERMELLAGFRGIRNLFALLPV